MNNKKYDGFCSVHKIGSNYECKNPDAKLIQVQLQMKNPSKSEPPNVDQEVLEQKEIEDLSFNDKIKETLVRNYDEMKQNGVFNTITVFDLGSNSFMQEEIKSKIKDIDWTDCPQRTNDITLVGIDRFEHELYLTPCRKGRIQNVCNYAIKETGLLYPTNCSLCDLFYNYKYSPCIPFRRIKIIFSDGFYIIPNLFPYFTSYHYLITLNPSIKQIPHDTQSFIYKMNTIKKISILAPKLLINKDDTLFFNGLVGNSKEHFHIQYVSYHFPIYDFLQIDKREPYAQVHNCNIYIFNSNNKLFRTAFSIQSINVTNLCVILYHMINECRLRRYEINILIHKNDSLEYECIVFPRSKVEFENKKDDLNFGSTELSGYIQSESEFSDETLILPYLLNTNNMTLKTQTDIVAKIAQMDLINLSDVSPVDADGAGGSGAAVNAINAVNAMVNDSRFGKRSRRKRYKKVKKSRVKKSSVNLR